MNFPIQSENMTNKRARTIVIGNEKGGSGKSTTAIHLIIGLLRTGVSVASIDLDGRQGSLTRFLEMRYRYASKNAMYLARPDHEVFTPGPPPATAGQDRVQSDEQAAAFQTLLGDLSARYDAIVIDTPGSDMALSRLAHVHADTLITPLNDSFVDLDVLAVVDPDSMTIERPSQYAETIWQQRTMRAARGLKATDWIIMRNRLSNLNANSKREMARLLEQLCKRFGCRQVDGFGERVIFRELFLKGLTIMDSYSNAHSDVRLSMSHVAARQEIRNLVQAVGITTHTKLKIMPKVIKRSTK